MRQQQRDASLLFVNAIRPRANVKGSNDTAPTKPTRRISSSLPIPNTTPSDESKITMSDSTAPNLVTDKPTEWMSPGEVKWMPTKMIKRNQDEYSSSMEQGGNDDLIRMIARGTLNLSEQDSQSDENSKEIDPIEKYPSIPENFLADLFYSQINGESFETVNLNPYSTYENRCHNDGVAKHDTTDSSTIRSSFAEMTLESEREVTSTNSRIREGKRNITCTNIASTTKDTITTRSEGSVSRTTCASDENNTSTIECSRFTSNAVATDLLVRSSYEMKLSSPELPEENFDFIDDDRTDVSEITNDEDITSVSSQPVNIEEEDNNECFNSDKLGKKPRTETTSATKHLQSVKTNKAGRVQFRSVQVRYYERILDIHPSCSAGAPIGIGWNFIKSEEVSIKDWEFGRGHVRKSYDLRLSPTDRATLLKEIGYKNNEIVKAIRSVRKAKGRRRQTIVNLKASEAEEAVEDAVQAAKRRVKKVKKVLTLGGLKRKK